jgi:uncharacterized membrane protein (DUF485 family)
VSHSHDPHRRTRRIGLGLFFVYFALYAAFIYLSAFRADIMASHAFAQVNVAVAFGFGLILLPLALAVVYLGAVSDEPSDGGGAE